MPRQNSLTPELKWNQMVKNAITILLIYLPLYIGDYILDWTNGLNLAGIIDTHTYTDFNIGDDTKLGKLCSLYNGTESPGFHNTESFYNGTESSGYHDTETSVFHWSDEPNATYGILTILTTFVPGLCCALGNIFGYILQKETPDSFNNYDPAEAMWKMALKTIALIFFYPFYVCYLLIKACYKQDIHQFEKLLIVISMEAFLEAAPQILLQLHIIMNGQCPTVIQLVSLCFSIISICKVAIEFHVGSQIFFTIGFTERITKTFKLLPLYMSCLYFRIGTLVLLVSHFKWWVLIPLSITIVILAITAKRTGHTEMQSFLAGPINLLVMAQGIDTSKLVASKQQQECQELDVGIKKSFYKTSTSIIFFIYSILLVFLMVLWGLNNSNIKMPEFLVSHWKKTVFMEGSIKSYALYTVASSILFSGLLNIIFLTIDVSSTLAENTNHPEEEQREMTIHSSPSSASGSHPSTGITAVSFDRFSNKPRNQSIQSSSTYLSASKPKKATPPDSSDSNDTAAVYDDNAAVYENQDGPVPKDYLYEATAIKNQKQSSGRLYLSFERGDTIYVTKTETGIDHWIEGFCNGRIGIFPSDFVKHHR